MDELEVPPNTIQSEFARSWDCGSCKNPSQKYTEFKFPPKASAETWAASKNLLKLTTSVISARLSRVYYISCFPHTMTSVTSHVESRSAWVLAPASQETQSRMLQGRPKNKRTDSQIQHLWGLGTLSSCDLAMVYRRFRQFYKLYLKISEAYWTILNPRNWELYKIVVNWLVDCRLSIVDDCRLRPGAVPWTESRGSLEPGNELQRLQLSAHLCTLSHGEMCKLWANVSKCEQYVRIHQMLSPMKTFANLSQRKCSKMQQDARCNKMQPDATSNASLRLQICMEESPVQHGSPDIPRSQASMCTACLDRPAPSRPKGFLRNQHSVSMFPCVSLKFVLVKAFKQF